MMLVLTLLCRDEADILESMLRFHLAQGVDRIIATDNGSVDGSLEILQRFERRGQLTLLQETEQTHDQAVWVTRMARMAAAMGADWVINSDADEFWWPQQGNLNSPWPSSPKALKACWWIAPTFCHHRERARINAPFIGGRPYANGSHATALAGEYHPS